MWYNPVDTHYFFGVSTCHQTVTTTGCLGVIDAGTRRRAPSVDPAAGTAPGSHSVTADARTNQVYVPIRGNSGILTPPYGSLCSTVKDVFGNLGSDNLGCIAVYTATSDTDDTMP